MGATDILEILGQYGECEATYTCGDPVLFDSYSYETVLIGNQCWFAENLRTTIYANGEPISQPVIDEWMESTQGATAVYGEDYGDAGDFFCDEYSPDIEACDELTSSVTYGRLYNWYATSDSRGLCPIGWHIPADEEWAELSQLVASGNDLKSTSGWYSDGNGTDNFGFSALPGGYCSWESDEIFFNDAGRWGNWWGATTNCQGQPMAPYLSWNSTDLNFGNWPPSVGMSVRCLKDSAVSLIAGCTYPDYLEYNSDAGIDDGSCATLIVTGCTDSLFLEFNPSANVDDGSCQTPITAQWTCGDPTLFDGYFYETVQIGNQCWFAENLRTTIYLNGDTIPNMLGDDWCSGPGSNTPPALGSCDIYGMPGDPGCQNIDSLACDTAHSLSEYGRLYNWYAVDDDRGLCPVGWRVPSRVDWFELSNFAESLGIESHQLGPVFKASSGWDFWEYSLGNGNNALGFNGKPAGERRCGSFVHAGYATGWWSSTQYAESAGGLNNSAWARALESNQNNFDEDNWQKNLGFSVRCLKD